MKYIIKSELYSKIKTQSRYSRSHNLKEPNTEK